MVIKVYISGISGNKEVKKRQQRVLMILESKNVEYEVIDITEPGKEADKEFMQMNSSAKDSKYPLPPQIFNQEDYCGDYEDFDEANELDELEKFLKGPTVSSNENSDKSKSQQNGNASSREPSMDKDNTTAAADDSEGRKASETDNDALSDNIKRSGSETEIKDLSDLEDGDLEKDSKDQPQDDKPQEDKPQEDKKDDDE